VIGISAQDVSSHEEFSGKHGFAFPLLADIDKHVSKQYGILGPLGFPRRSVFVVDGKGIVRYVHRALAGLTYRPVQELVEAVEKAKLDS
jgi:peroxiredoxin Q/BCP